jgi:hypothetical protein
MAETACPVADMGREVEALWAVFLANDRRVVKLKDGQEHDRLELENEHLVDRRDALEELAACTPARSPVGAMFQIMVARAAADAIASYREEAWAKEVSRYCRQVDGCLYSALRLLEELSGTPAEEVGAKHYMSRAFDPHAMLTAAVAREPIPPAPDGAGTDE